MTDDGPATRGADADGTPTLTRRVAGGDPDALATLYERWFDDMVRWAGAATRRDEAFCLDVVQESFLRVIRAIPVLQSEASLGAWLRRVVVTTALDMLRCERRRIGRERVSAERMVREAGERGAELDEQLRLVREQLAQLPPGEHRLVEARHRFGWTFARIGRRFGLTTSAASGRVQRSVASMGRVAREADND